MDLWAMLGVSRQAALGGMAAGVVAAVIAARVLLRRAGDRGRNVVRLTNRD